MYLLCPIVRQQASLLQSLGLSAGHPDDRRTWASRLRDELKDAGQRARLPVPIGDAIYAEAHRDAPGTGQVQRRTGQRLAQQRPRPGIPRGLCACQSSRSQIEQNSRRWALFEGH